MLKLLIVLSILLLISISSFAHDEKDSEITTARIEHEIKMLSDKIKRLGTKVEKAVREEFKSDDKKKPKKEPTKTELDKLADELNVLSERVRALGKDKEAKN